MLPRPREVSAQCLAQLEGLTNVSRHLCLACSTAPECSCPSSTKLAASSQLPLSFHTSGPFQTLVTHCWAEASLPPDTDPESSFPGSRAQPTLVIVHHPTLCSDCEGLQGESDAVPPLNNPQCPRGACLAKGVNDELMPLVWEFCPTPTHQIAK